MAKEQSTAFPPGDRAPSWRELAVARSLDPARARAEARVQRFIDAAIELMNGEAGADFTLQQVVERSGQSLRSFYQHFEGKHELVLALFEESVRATADHLRAAVAAEAGPRERLHRLTVDYYRLCRPAATGFPAHTELTPALAEFAQQLLTSYPKEASLAFAPLVALFEEVLAEAAAAGVVRPEASRGVSVGVVLQAIMFNAFSLTISGLPSPADPAVGAERTWELVLHGLRGPAAP